MRQGLRTIIDFLGDPKVLRRFHLIATWVWILLIWPTVTWWKESVLVVLVYSVWANVAGHWSSWQSARVEDNPSLTDEDCRRIARIIRSEMADLSD